MIKMQIRARNLIEDIKEFMGLEDGMGTIEMVFLVLILVGLAFMFKGSAEGIMEKVLKKLETGVDKVSF